MIPTVGEFDQKSRAASSLFATNSEDAKLRREHGRQDGLVCKGWRGGESQRQFRLLHH